jgi:hypothetical protein
MPLPLLPEGSMRWKLEWSVDESLASTQHWVFLLDAALMSFAEFEEFHGDLITWALELVEPMSTSTQLEASRLFETGLNTREDFQHFAPNHGAAGTGMAINVGAGLYWIVQESGRRGHSISHIPGVPVSYSDDARHLNALGVTEMEGHAAAFFNGVNAIVAPNGNTPRLSAARLRSGGAPLTPPLLLPIEGVVPVTRLTTLKRRIR